MGNPVEMKPLMVSKANTAVQIVLAAVVLAELAFAADFGPVRPALIILSGLLTVASAGAYLVAWSRHMNSIWRRRSPSTDDEIADAALAARFRRQIRFWLITAACSALFVYVFSDILLPFVAGMVLAYFLDPVADRLERIGPVAHGRDVADPVRLRRRARRSR